MKCPYCQHDESKVVDKRETLDGVNRRRRECLKCSQRFTTYERIKVETITVIKKDGRKEPFSFEKLMGGLRIATEKRGISEEKLQKVAHDIERSIKKKQLALVKSKQIGNLVLAKLKKLDEMAYIRFASVYKTIENIKELKAEIRKIK